RVVGFFFKAAIGANLPIDLIVKLGRIIGGAADDERGSGFVDQNGVDLVDNTEVKLALDVIFQAKLHVVAKVIKAELVVRSVSNIAAIVFLALLVAQAMNDHARGKPEEAMDLSHPLGVTSGEVIVHR